MKTYEVTLHRVVEHETTYRIKANNEEEAEELVISDNYNEIVSDSEICDVENDVINIEQV